MVTRDLRTLAAVASSAGGVELVLTSLAGIAAQGRQLPHTTHLVHRIMTLLTGGDPTCSKFAPAVSGAKASTELGLVLPLLLDCRDVFRQPYKPSVTEGLHAAISSPAECSKC